MRSLKALKEEKGFTIVELIIVIVVIGILAVLVITTFSNIQRRARDTDRQNDIKSIHSVLEVYYADNGYYPSLTQLTAGLPGMDDNALVPPTDNAATINAAAATTDKYQYATDPDNCDNGANGNCTEYTLSALLEDGSTFTRSSLAN